MAVARKPRAASARTNPSRRIASGSTNRTRVMTLRAGVVPLDGSKRVSDTHETRVRRAARHDVGPPMIDRPSQDLVRRRVRQFRRWSVTKQIEYARQIL